jgi:hypothetical protein
MSSNDPMNDLIRNSRSYPTFDASTVSSDTINRALREAAGIDQPPPQPAQPTPQLPALGGSDYHLADDEPLPAAEPKEWERWIYRRRVISLLDQQGRLPGEAGYDRATTGPGNPDSFNMTAAVAARRNRWRQRTGT